MLVSRVAKCHPDKVANIINLFSILENDMPYWKIGKTLNGIHLPAVRVSSYTTVNQN